ncbi:MAG: hypothetical protein ACF8NJ_04690 [Phycisphaerales bacterium JB038]
MASSCAECKLRRRAEAKPKSLTARLWRWHTKWCPGWKAYQRELAAQVNESEERRDACSS